MQRTGVSAVTAYSAHREWATRRSDERFASVSALYEAACVRRARTDERTETHQVRTAAETDDDLVVREASGHTAPLTHWRQSHGGLFRGFILRNSDVGAAALTLNVFLYRAVCGTNIIWSFRHVAGFRRRHNATGQGATSHSRRGRSW